MPASHSTPERPSLSRGIHAIAVSRLPDIIAGVAVVFALLASPAAAQERAVWVDRLVSASDAGGNWREAFALGQQVAELPEGDGLAVLREAWPRMRSAIFKQQLVKAWHLDLPTPYGVRLHDDTFAFVRMVLSADEPEVSPWVLGNLSTYAWRGFDDEAEALQWLDSAAGMSPTEAFMASQRSWIESWREADRESRSRLVEQLGQIGYPYRRNEVLARAAERDGLATILVGIVEDESWDADARSTAFSRLMGIRPDEYDIEAFRAFSDAMRAELKREQELARRRAEARLRPSIRLVDDDPRKRWILHAPLDQEPPSDGYGLLLVFPGGDGSLEFANFVADGIRPRAGRDFAVVQMIAPPISEGDDSAVVWPQELLGDDRVDFTMEPVVDSVLAAVREELAIDPERVFSMGWSSGGPPAYAVALREGSPVRGGLVVMSVYKPALLPPRDSAAGRGFYILHSPQDFIPMRFPESAADDLKAHGARVRLETYEGGHGWVGDATDHISRAVRWLEGE